VNDTPIRGQNSRKIAINRKSNSFVNNNKKQRIMTLKKGETNNPNGRPKGKPNKATAELKTWITELIDNNRDQLEIDLKSMQPKERWQIIERLMQYTVPKMQNTQMEMSASDSQIIKVGYGSLSALSDDELRSLETMQKKVGYKPPTVIKWGNKEIEL